MMWAKQMVRTIAPEGLRKAVRAFRIYLSEFPDRMRWRRFCRQLSSPPGAVVLAGDGDAKRSEEKRLEEEADLKERNLRACLMRSGVKSLLEVGIGDWPHLDRLRWMVSHGIQYTACDFERVCELHKHQTKANGISVQGFEYLGNCTGTYAWTLFRLLKENRKFDAVYIDGHHTFLVDLPAFFIADRLLDPGGLLMVDDIEWTLEFMKTNMARDFYEWRFYKDAYEFGQYTEEEQRSAHIGLIVQDIMLSRLGYELVDEFSEKNWYALRKPSGLGVGNLSGASAALSGH